MINRKKIFTGGIDADSDERFISQEDYLNAENVRVAVSEFGRNLRVENIPSTQLIYDIELPYNNFTIGSTIDEGRNWLIWAVWNPYDLHGIYAYDISNQVGYIVLLSSQTEEGFNFSKSFRIDNNMKVAGDLLLWTDANNEPQSIDIMAGVKLNQPSYDTETDAYDTPILYETTTLIKRPPIYRLEVEKVTDALFTGNYTQNNAYFFLYRYQYKNNQYSAMSAHSQRIPFNSFEETYNAIEVSVPFSEAIPDYVQQVDLCVKFGNEGTTEIIKSYNKNNYYDRLAIESHNENITKLGTTYYGNTVGILVPSIPANTSFHNVALKAKTLEVARNRTFLGNVTKGYDTPSGTSLTASLATINTGGAGTYVSEWKYFNLFYYSASSPSILFDYQYYYAYNASLNPKCYLYNSYQTVVPPATLNAADADIQYYDETALAQYVLRNYPPPPGFLWSFYTAPTFADDGYTLDIVVTSDLGNIQFFKSKSGYYVTKAFYDRFRRKSGVVNEFVTVTTNERTYAQSVFSATISWALSNLDAVNEIPDWAWYYQIHISKNLTTRKFVQCRTVGAAYAVKNQDGTYTYSATTFNKETTYALAINITALTSFGLGYVFAENDYARIIDSSNNIYTVKIIGQDENYVLCSPIDIGTVVVATTRLLTELYTPYLASLTEPMYETGEIMNIDNPGTASRQYSVLSGTINGDCYAIQREQSDANTYFAEAMSPNDNTWSEWVTDTGWVNYVDTIGQTVKDTNIDYSNTWINGTKINGFNVFEVANTEDIGNETGSIQKLQLVNKLQDEGTVMLCITETTPVSIYLGEVQIYDATQEAFVAKSTAVIGSINALKESYGTLHPGTVKEHHGIVSWLDIRHGVVAQYGNQGVTAVSNFKVRRFFDRYGKRYVEQGTAAIEALCGFSHITACYDPSTDEYMIILPQVEADNFVLELPSFSSVPSYASSIQNKFDIYDGMAKTISYKFEQNRWGQVYQWIPDCMEYAGNKLFGFKDGNLYLQNEDNTSFNNIYGTEYPQRICFVCNTDPSAILDLFNIAIEANAKPNFSVAYSEYPDIQITDLASQDYRTTEGVQFARWFRDRLSPNAAGTADQKLYTGDVLKGAYIMVMIEFQEYDNQLKVNFVNLGVEISNGISQILNK